MKKSIVLLLALLLLCLAGCRQAKKGTNENTTAAAGESAGAPVENSQQEPVAAADDPASTAQAASGSANQMTAPNGSAAGTPSPADTAAPAAATLSKEDIEKLIKTANDLTLGWLNVGFEAKDHFDQSDTFDKPMDEYYIPYIRVSGAAYDSVQALEAAVSRVYTADAAAIFDGFIGTMYVMQDGKLYANSAIGQGGDVGGVRAALRLLSQTADECRVQVDYISDPSAGGGVDDSAPGTTVRSETLTLKKENGTWKFTSPVSLFGLYFNWYQLTWAE